MTQKTPKRLKQDAIIEALCEIRFKTDAVPEVVVGRLSDAWEYTNQTRLPTADIPNPIRMQDPNLKHTPVLQLNLKDPEHLVKVGSNVISYHVLNNYCGWNLFHQKLKGLCDVLFEKIPNIEVTRIGFRYLNAVTSTKHGIKSFHDLNLELKVDSIPITGSTNINYINQYGPQHVAMTRIASIEFVEGGHLPKNTVGFIDIDISTPINFSSKSQKEVFRWIDDAHDYEKLSFFKLIPKKQLDKIVAEWEE